MVADTFESTSESHPESLLLIKRAVARYAPTAEFNGWIREPSVEFPICKPWVVDTALWHGRNLTFRVQALADGALTLSVADVDCREPARVLLSHETGWMMVEWPICLLENCGIVSVWSKDPIQLIDRRGRPVCVIA